MLNSTLIKDYNELPMFNENTEHTNYVYRYVEMIKNQITYPGVKPQMPTPKSKEEYNALSRINPRKSPLWEIVGTKKII